MSLSIEILGQKVTLAQAKELYEELQKLFEHEPTDVTQEATYGQLLAEKTALDAAYLEKLEKLRFDCQHTDYDVMYYSWRIGTMVPTRICKFCGKVIGEPSPEELTKFFQDERAANKKLWAKNYPGVPFPELTHPLDLDHNTTPQTFVPFEQVKQQTPQTVVSYGVCAPSTWCGDGFTNVTTYCFPSSGTTNGKS